MWILCEHALYTRIIFYSGDAMPSRQRHQKSVRKGHVKIIVDQICKKLHTKGHQKRMHNTNRILPVGGLRRNSIKNIFGGWVLQFIGKGRILTFKLAKDVCRRVRKRFEMPSSGEWVTEEVRRMHYLLKAARKRQIGKPIAKVAPAMSTMDCLDTVPMFADEHWEEQLLLICRTIFDSETCLAFLILYLCSQC